MLRAWADSPARFREDANAEEDLRVGGYRDRVLVELAQNAADAAELAGGGGAFAVSVVGGELRAANTGAPLDAAGVASLASLRASAKRDRETSGHFGVGFAAVLGVTDAPAVHSRHGGVCFSAAATRDAVAELADAAAGNEAGDAPTLAAELAARAGSVPVLRLPWPTEGAVPDGFVTEVRLPLFADVDPAELLEQARRTAPDLLLAFPALRAITVDGERITAERARERVTIGSQRWVVAGASGQLGTRGGLGVEHTGRYAVTWAVPVDEAGVPQPVGADVLHTPTPTDERLSLPARLLAFVPMEPHRRRVREGAATEAVLDAAVDAYPSLLRRFPAARRLGLVPRPGFPTSEVDARLREGLLERCRTEPLLPAAGGSEIAASGALALQHRAVALRSLLSDAVPGLLGEVDDEAALRALGVRRLGLAEIAEAILGLQRAPSWWHELYAALAEAVDAGADREELGALPVPMLDGRTLPGPRGALLPDRALVPIGGLEALELPIVHPEAAHPLLTRLGAVTAGPGELLDTAELRARVERSVEDAAAGLDTSALADVVLRLIGEGGDGHGHGLGALALRDADGGARRADELLFPDAALRPVLEQDAVGPDEPLAVLAAEVADHYPREALAAVGVLDGFAVVTDEDPVAPDHGLPDEQQWWETGPRVLHGIRDLDLVAEHAWEPALAAIAGEPHTWHALTEPGGYTGWWIARYATLAGHEPRHWRLPRAVGLAGLYDPLPATELSEATLVAAGVRTELRAETADDAAELLDRLADRAREPAPGTVLEAHTRLALAVRDGRIEPGDVPAPARVRAVEGHVDAEQALVADTPWLAGSGAGELVVLPTELAEPLAALLDVPLASAELDTAVSTAGEPAAWAGFAAVVAACGLLGLPVPDGEVVLHDPLVVTIDGERFEPPWWVEGATVHACDDERGLARALAWCAGAWADRYRVESVLRDPGLAALLG